MSVFQNAKVHKNPPSRSLDIRIFIKSVLPIKNVCKFFHINFDCVLLNVSFAIPGLFQLETSSLECQFSKTPKFIKIHPAVR